jgi:hypothetical protein
MRRRTQSSGAPLTQRISETDILNDELGSKDESLHGEDESGAKDGCGEAADDATGDRCDDT